MDIHTTRYPLDYKNKELAPKPYLDELIRCQLMHELGYAVSE